MVAVEAGSFEESTMVSVVSFKKAGAFVVSSLEDKNTKKTCSCEEKYYGLVDYDCLPNYMKHNEFILSYYRPEWPWKQTILSIFSIHNETINVWTHLIGFFVFLALTTGTAMMAPRDGVGALAPLGNSPSVIHPELGSIASSVPNMSDFRRIATEVNASSSHSTETTPSLLNWLLPQAFININLPDRSYQANNTNSLVMDEAKEQGQPITRWPFYAFLIGAMFCLFTSSACHLLSCHSECCSYVMLRLDYAGISTLIVTSFYPLVYYTFMCDPFYRNLYIGFITAFGIATILVSLITIFETPEFRIVRAGLFFCMGVSGLVPIIHKLVLFNHRPEVVVTTAYELVMGGFYGLGVLLYATRIPERWLQGKFDLAGHSHQLFHVLVIAGAYTHYLAGLVYLQWRDVEGC